MKYFFSLILILNATSFPNAAFAGFPPPTPEALPSNEQPVTVTYAGTGSASFNEIYTQSKSGQCSIETVTSNEAVSAIKWKSTWKKVRPVDKQYVTASTSSFSGDNFRTDSSNCGGFNLQCTSYLEFEEGYFPELRIKKSGKSYIVSINAEQSINGRDPSSSTCFQSSVFDNAITEGMNLKNVTGLRIKLTKAKESKKSRIKFKINKDFDCTDPAKTLAFLSNTCTITTQLSGTLVLNGRWTGKILK